MENIATIARENALHCEAKKHAYRQTQDGVVVSFVLHPNEVPEGLATANLGQRYMIAMVAIDDNEEPKQPQDKIVQRAAMLCDDKEFQAFLDTVFQSDFQANERSAAETLRSLLGIKSRKELATNPVSAAEFQKLLNRFEGWKRDYE